MQNNSEHQPRLFALLMLLSGFAGISYEILYGRILGNMVGDQFAVSAAILMTFLLGIGLGSAYAHRLWRWLWAIEAGIGLYGALIAFSQPVVERIVYAGSSMFADTLSGSILVCVLLLLVPTFLIGCSVPLFAGYFGRANGHHARVSFSWVYMVYNLGAAGTALLIEFWLIRTFGIRDTVALFAAVNLLIAIGLRARFKHMREEEKREAAGSFVIGNVFRLIPASRWLPLVLASIASAIFQLFMVKYAELVFGPFRESFALVLSLILFGITLGAQLVRRFAPGFSTVMWLNLAGLLWLMLAAGPAIYVYAALYGLVVDHFWWLVLLKWLMLAGLMLLPAIGFGATIPALLAHPGSESAEVSRESGALLFISSLANVAGFLLMVFVLHRLLDYGVQLLVIGGISALALLVYCRARLRHLVPACMLIAAMAGWQYYKWDEDLLFLSYTSFHDVSTLERERENFGFPDRYKGYQDVFSINWMNGKPFFFINGYISIPLNNPSEKMVGALSTLFSPRLDDALVLGLGSGATASSVGLFFKRTDVVEINPVVRDNLFRMAKWNFDIEHNPRVHIVVDDAIHDVKVDEQKYSMILNTVTTPLYFSSSKLYTRDFFDSIARRLTPDGIYITWMDSRIGDAGADIILRTLKKSFRHCAILYIKSSYFLLVASNEPLRVQQAEAVTHNAELASDLLVKHGVNAAWLPYQLMQTNVYTLIDNPDGPVNTADDPVLEFAMARLHYGSIHRFKSRLENSFDIADVRKALGNVGEAFPADYLAQAENQLGNSSITLRWKQLLSRDPDYAHKAMLAELEKRRIRADIEKTAAAYHAVGTQLTRLERYTEAIAVFDKVLDIDPSYIDAYYNLGTCHEHLGEDAEALTYFFKVEQLNPKDPDANYRIGRLLLRMGQFQRALDALNEHIETQHPKSGIAYLYRALAYKALGQAKLAEADLQRALDLPPEDEQVLKNVGL
jgi:spermidine synthase